MAPSFVEIEEALRYKPIEGGACGNWRILLDAASKRMRFFRVFRGFFRKIILNCDGKTPARIILLFNAPCKTRFLWITTKLMTVQRETSIWENGWSWPKAEWLVPMIRTPKRTFVS